LLPAASGRTRMSAKWTTPPNLSPTCLWSWASHTSSGCPTQRWDLGKPSWTDQTGAGLNSADQVPKVAADAPAQTHGQRDKRAAGDAIRQGHVRKSPRGRGVRVGEVAANVAGAANVPIAMPAGYRRRSTSKLATLRSSARAATPPRKNMHPTGAGFTFPHLCWFITILWLT
jgi:hypothetical protein